MILQILLEKGILAISENANSDLQVKTLTLPLDSTMVIA